PAGEAVRKSGEKRVKEGVVPQFRPGIGSTEYRGLNTEYSVTLATAAGGEKMTQLVARAEHEAGSAAIYSADRAFGGTVAFEFPEGLDAIQYVRWSGGAGRIRRSCAQKRVALGQHSRSKCGAVEDAASLPINQEPAKPRVDGHAGDGLAERRQAAVVNGFQPSQQRQRLLHGLFA